MAWLCLFSCPLALDLSSDSVFTWAGTSRKWGASGHCAEVLRCWVLNPGGGFSQWDRNEIQAPAHLPPPRPAPSTHQSDNRRLQPPPQRGGRQLLSLKLTMEEALLEGLFRSKVRV